MAFAPPALVDSLALLSPALRRMPLAVHRRIIDAGDVPGPGRYRVTGITSALNVRASASLNAAVVATVKNGELGTSDGTVDNGFAFIQFDSGPSGWSSVAFLAPEASAAVTSGGASAPKAPDLAAGAYAAKVDDWLNLRSGPTTTASVIGKILPGEIVQASGLNDNYFAQVKTKDGIVGWAAAGYLVPATQAIAGGDLVLTGSDLIQLRTMLTAWAHATKATDYGTPDDLLFDAAAMSRQTQAVEAFQKWNNSNKGTALRTDGIVDQATRDALVAWSQGAVAGSPAVAPTDPALPPPEPTGDGAPSIVETVPAGKAAGAGAIVLLLVAGLGAFLVLEEKKRKRA